MEKIILTEPNRHIEAYRSLESAPNIPELYPFLDFIDISEDGHVLIGSSSLTSRSWGGSVFYFRDTESAAKHENIVAKRTFPSGVPNGKFLKDRTKMLIAEDSGTISLFSLAKNESDENELAIEKVSEEHDYGIVSLSITPGDRYFFTGDMGGCIKVWDTENTRRDHDGIFDSIHSYSYAHKDTITCLSAHLKEKDVFVSTSAEGEAYLWDCRLDKPASCLYKHSFCGLTQIAWHPARDNLIAISSEDGDVYLVDPREPKEFTAKSKNFDDSISKIEFNDGMLLAASAHRSVKIIDCGMDDMNIIYDDDSHADTVTGLAWKNPSHLISCGWGSNILHHYV